MPINDGNAALDQTVGERDLFTRDFVAPIATPMDGHNNHIARLLMGSHLIAHSRCGRFREVIEQIHSRGNVGGLPFLRDAAARCSE